MNDAERGISDCEAEAAAVRTRIASTIDEIQERLSPRNLLQDAVDAVSGRGAEAVENARRRMKRHPVAVSLAGAAIGLALGTRAFKSNGKANHMTRYDQRNDAQESESGRIKRGWSKARDGAHDARRAVSAKAGEARQAVSNRAGEARDYAAERYRSARDYSAEKWDQTRERAGEYAERTRAGAVRAREQTAEGVDHHPLTAAAIGAAIGAVIGVLLPRTRQEDGLMGDASDRTTESLRSAARAARDAGRTRFDELGVKDRASSELKALREQAGDIARSAGDAAKREVRKDRDPNGSGAVH